MSFRPLAALACLAVAALPAASASGADRANARQPPIAMVDTVTIEPGSFRHPRPGEFLKDGHPAEAPQILAEVQRPLEIMKYQVSSSDYGRCVEARECAPAEAHTVVDRPVTGVSHIDAQAYAAWYSDMTGGRWRLPTDVEWAFAAGERFRGDIEAGEADPSNPAQRWLALYRAESNLDRKPDPEARAPGSFGTNSKGLADIAGNVWEWTSTCYANATLSSDGAGVDSVVENCGVHVVEGFHRTYMSNFIRDGKSGGCAVGTPPDNLGFRLVREKPGLAEAIRRILGIS
ncbi:MAG: SUMF1/EgtB/PvdO family nonheme iron enzyme [Pseudaminobacter sp.]|nr:SUMF1/EgtB/PvdO family nonheme iron enzyme [Pseudaminobacter sp.]